MEGIELICFQIISGVGSARSYYIEAIQKAKENRFEEAEKCVSLGKEIFLEGHKAHANLIKNEASGNITPINLLLVHSEDQLMSAEAFGILSEEFIDIYKVINK
ncbi:MAG: PTS lactose/cellobiose transporter subunit IIA [Bacilli bacterium]